MFPSDAWKYFETPPRMDRLVLAVDPSNHAADSADLCGILLVGKHGKDFYVMENHSARLTALGTMERIREVMRRWPDAHIVVEKAANGYAILEQLSREFSIVKGLSAAGGSGNRIVAASAFVESGCVFLPKEQVWVSGFIDEHQTFPRGEHDDQAVAFAYAVAYLVAEQNKSAWLWE
jgi:predicted phage terminase large subunit-like protein